MDKLFWLMPLIFAVAFLSVVSGGVGLLSRPILILFGFPPTIALGTFRVANLFSRIAGAVSIIEQQGAKNVDWMLALRLFVPSLIGGVIGAEIVSVIDASMLKKTLGVVTLVLGGIFLLNRNLGIVAMHHQMTLSKQIIGFFATLLIGVIAAFVGGSGILFAYLLIFNYDKSFLSSAPVRKLANFGSALSSSILFLWHGYVDWRLMLALMISDGLGEYLGGRFQMKHDAKWIRRITLVTVSACGIAMFFF
ncbi:MAG: sulfite exporter TauE/SafE family protein [Rhabdochlamydiaceae bacterium]|nr:sulfite exporter TauE/SafE family protein [Rhabdochlamydiaceae bacterium]